MSPPPHASSLAMRLATAGVGIPVLLAVAWLGGWAFVALVTGLVVLGLGEFAWLARRMGLSVPIAWLVIGGFLTPALFHAFGSAALAPTLVAFSAGTMVLVLALPTAVARFSVAGAILFGYVYVAVLLGHLVLLRDLGGPERLGARCVFLVFVLTWSCDTAAYAVGKLWGRRRPWPGLSPRKSLEGAIAGLVAAVGAAVVARWWFAPFLSPWEAAGFGALLGVICQVGDLFESGIKRGAGLKDTSSLLPGHGGLLDRFDSMILSAPAAVYFLRAVLGSA